MTVPDNIRGIKRGGRTVEWMNLLVLALSIALIIWISVDTFTDVPLLQSAPYMRFQFWVCMVFIADFFIGLHATQHGMKLGFAKRRAIFLLLSIPWLNIISVTGMELGPDALYFVRFIPLARGALAISIVIGWMSSSAVSSLFMSYLIIMLMVAYFCSLIFYQREHVVNPQVQTYWTALWWAAMNMSTVGCDISPLTVAGKVVAVVLPVSGMVIFPLFTVYLTDYVTRTVKRYRSGVSSSDDTPGSDPDQKG